MWLENSKKPDPSSGKGGNVPIDPLTGKPFNFLPPGVNAFGGGGGSGAGGANGGDQEECPHHVLPNATIVEKCGNDPNACSVCMLTRKRRKTPRSC